MGFPGGSVAKKKKLPANARDTRDASLIPVKKIPRRREWIPTPVFLPGKSHGQRILADYSSWGYSQT